MAEEIIEQSENLKIEYKYYKYPFEDKRGETPSKSEKIKRTMCGFLNSEGGIIFFGIREHLETKKRYIVGYHFSEKRKLEFRQIIFDLLKDVKPDVGKMCTLKWVPVKSHTTDNFGSGLFVPKVII
jgi:predicted HTH transcriptional regulator